MTYFQHKDLGFAKDAILIVPMPDEGPQNKDATLLKRKTLRDEMAAVAGVETVSLSSAPPSSGEVSKTLFTIEGDAQDHLTQVKQVDNRYLDIYKLELLGGKQLDDLDSMNGFVVNETFAKTLGIQPSTEIIGKSLKIWGEALSRGRRRKGFSYGIPRKAY